MTKEVILSLENVGVRFKLQRGMFRKPDYYQALEGLSLDIFRGETLGILGQNGAGKSTLLKVICGILRPDSGNVINKGVTVSLLSLQAGFDNELSGVDNAIIGGMLMGYTRKQVLERLTEITEFSGLGDFIQEPVKTYSSGMRSRLGFSVAVYFTPDVLLLDEVLSVGDQGFKEKAEKEMMKKIHSEQTIVFVSHSEAQINRLCDRTIFLEKKL